MFVVTFNYKKEFEDRTGTQLAFGEISDRQVRLTEISMGTPLGATLKHPQTRVKDMLSSNDLIFPVAKASVDALLEFVSMAELLAQSDPHHDRTMPYYHTHNMNEAQAKFERPGIIPILPDGRVTHDGRVKGSVSRYWNDEARKGQQPVDFAHARVSCWSGARFLMGEIAGINLGKLHSNLLYVNRRFQASIYLDDYTGKAPWFAKSSPTSEMLFLNGAQGDVKMLAFTKNAQSVSHPPVLNIFDEREKPHYMRLSDLPEQLYPLNILQGKAWVDENGMEASLLPRNSPLWGKGNPTHPALEPRSLHLHHD